MRPADFTRFSTNKQMFTPYIYEMATSTIQANLVNVNSTDDSSSEYYDAYEDYTEEMNIEPLLITTTTSSSSRPHTNTFNLLNRRTTTKIQTMTTTSIATTTTAITKSAKTSTKPNFFYYFKTLPPKYEYFFSTKKDTRKQTSRTQSISPG